MLSSRRGRASFYGYPWLIKFACTCGIALALWAATEREEALGVSWNVTTQAEQVSSEGRSHRTRRPMREAVLLDCSADESLCDELTAAIHEHFIGKVVRQAPWGTLAGIQSPPPETMALRLDYVDVDGQPSAFFTFSQGDGTVLQQTAPIARLPENQDGVSFSKRLVRSLRSIVNQTPD